MESTRPLPPNQLFPTTSEPLLMEIPLPSPSTLPALPPHLPQDNDLLKELTVPAVKQIGKNRSSKQMSGTNWFLTFPRNDTPKELVKERLLSAQRIQIKGFMIAQEHHQDGGLHLHIGLWLHKRVAVPPNYFDFVAGKHGNYLR